MIHRLLPEPLADGRHLTYCGSEKSLVKYAITMDEGVDCKDCIQQMKREKAFREWARLTTPK